MSSLILILALATAGDGSGVSASAQSASPTEAVTPTADSSTEARGYREIYDEMREVFRTHATAVTRDDRWIAVLRMVALYDELVTHPMYESSDTLASYRNQLWSRLVRAKKQIAREVAELDGSQPADRPSASEQVSLANSEAGRGGGFGPADEGRALIELIQRTIAPDHWDVAGGPGTIVYYAPLKALVVRANSRIHGRVGGILGGLRAAGP